MRDFEVKKIGFTPDMETKVTFKVPISVHETFQRIRGQDFRWVSAPFNLTVLLGESTSTMV